MCRSIQGRDVLECFSLDSSQLGEEFVGRQTAIGVWKNLIGMAAFNSTVIEVDPPLAGSRIVGFGGRVFVSRDFAESELAGARPGLYARFVAAIVEGRPILLAESQIRHANTHCGLDAVIVGGFRYRMLSREALAVSAAMLSARFLELHAGYWLNQLITEIASPEYRDFIESMRVWRIANNFETYYAQQLQPVGFPGRALAIIARDDALAVTSHAIGPLFVQKKPQLRLRDGDQHFLRVAALGVTDEDLARELGISISGIKKRWLSLYERVADADPNFFPEGERVSNGQTRGRQKRHVLIGYIRSHPEELFPFEW
jgi:hypothetical protein